eukprot:1013065-Rhodomonas_salina.1
MRSCRRRESSARSQSRSTRGCASATRSLSRQNSTMCRRARYAVPNTDIEYATARTLSGSSAR